MRAGRRRPGTTLVPGLLALAAALSSCSGGSGGEDAAPVTAPTSTAPPTTLPPTTTTAAATVPPTAPGPTTTSPASSPEGHATALYEAWTRGDRAAAERVARPEAVAALFSRQWRAGDGWAFAECSGAAGSVICTWQRPSGQLLMRVQSVTGGVPVMVSEVRFQP